MISRPQEPFVRLCILCPRQHGRAWIASGTLSQFYWGCQAIWRAGSPAWRPANSSCTRAPTCTMSEHPRTPHPAPCLAPQVRVTPHSPWQRLLLRPQVQALGPAPAPLQGAATARRQSCSGTPCNGSQPRVSIEATPASYATPSEATNVYFKKRTEVVSTDQWAAIVCRRATI